MLVRPEEAGPQISVSEPRGNGVERRNAGGNALGRGARHEGQRSAGNGFELRAEGSPIFAFCSPEHYFCRMAAGCQGQFYEGFTETPLLKAALTRTI